MYNFSRSTHLHMLLAKEVRVARTTKCSSITFFWLDPTIAPTDSVGYFQCRQEKFMLATYRQQNGCKNMRFVIRRNLQTFYLLLALLHVVFELVQYTFNITPPSNVSNMFGDWLDGVEKKNKAQIHVGTCALVQSLWNCWNDIILINVQLLMFHRSSVQLLI